MENENYLVVISADHMGSGNDELGSILMKSFLFALNQQNHLPQEILLYNSGVRLVCEGSESLEDLRSLEKAGVRIASCGTCLDFFGLTKSICLGEITNMYAIVEAQTKASRLICP